MENLRSKKYLQQFLILFIWIGVVILIFKIIDDRQVAAVFAGIGFILWPTLFILAELCSQKSNKIHVALLSFFLFANAVPIFLLRVLNWGEDFVNLRLFGIPAQSFHKFSNLLYLIVMASCLFHYFSQKKVEKD